MSKDLENINIANVNPPLVEHIYIADPSAHIFEGKIYIYPSHDVVNDIPHDDLGSQYAMEDYHVIRMDRPESKAVDCGQVLHVDEIPWAHKQLWAPDAAEKNGKYYLYFPAKRPDEVFQIGVATANNPEGPFIPQEKPIEGSYSIDPAVFKDDDGTFYMYFGGIWGGQLQKYRQNKYGGINELPADDSPALGPRIARLSDDMLQFDEDVKEITILDEHGNPLLNSDNERRFFEASWMHKYNGKYYFSYSTGDTHFICYAIADNPYGPFTYAGRILEPVVGWTSHHSILSFEGRWFLFYHDAVLSEGQSHLRSVKMLEFRHETDGRILTINPYPNESN